METRYDDEYQLSPRVTLRYGDYIRVSKGPYWRGGSGERVALAARGIYRFLHVARRGRQVFLVARNAAGTAVIHVEGRRRNSLMPELVCRHYAVRRVKCPTARGRRRVRVSE